MTVWLEFRVLGGGSWKMEPLNQLSYIHSLASAFPSSLHWYPDFDLGLQGLTTINKTNGFPIIGH